MESYWFFDQLVDVLIGGEQTGRRYSLHVLGEGRSAEGPHGIAHTIEVTGPSDLHALVTALPAGDRSARAARDAARRLPTRSGSGPAGDDSPQR
jgi:hypothetical protein